MFQKLGQKIHSAARRIERLDDPIRAFFEKSYDERVGEVQRLYAHEVKKAAMDRYFVRTTREIEDEIALNPRFFFDVMLGYAMTVKPAAVMQFGCYVMSELQWLTMRGYEGRTVGIDFSQDHIDYLRKGFAESPFAKVELRQLDIERATAADFDGIEMVTAYAVMSNIQPEGMCSLMRAMAASSVKVFAVGDMYTDRSMGGRPGKSVPMPDVRNWFHRYRAFGREVGFGCTFVPDFCFRSYREARGTFVLHRGLDDNAHRQAMAVACEHYLARQDKLWDHYDENVIGA